MRFHVYSQTTFLSGSISTDFASEWSFPSMSSYMSSHRVLSTAWKVTKCTFMRFVYPVNFFMTIQVGLAVSFEMTTETWAAQASHRRSLMNCLHMLFQHVSSFYGMFTILKLTAKVSFFRVSPRFMFFQIKFVFTFVRTVGDGTRKWFLVWMTVSEVFTKNSFSSEWARKWSLIR